MTQDIKEKKYPFNPYLSQGERETPSAKEADLDFGALDQQETIKEPESIKQEGIALENEPELENKIDIYEELRGYLRNILENGKDIKEMAAKISESSEARFKEIDAEGEKLIDEIVELVKDKETINTEIIMSLIGGWLRLFVDNSELSSSWVHQEEFILANKVVTKIIDTINKWRVN